MYQWYLHWSHWKEECLLFHFIIVNNPFHNYPGFVLQAKSAIFTAKRPARAYSVGQPNASSIWLTLEVFLNRLRTKRAARLWTASILAKFFCEYGSQTDAAAGDQFSTVPL